VDEKIVVCAEMTATVVEGQIPIRAVLVLKRPSNNSKLGIEKRQIML